MDSSGSISAGMAARKTIKKWLSFARNWWLSFIRNKWLSFIRNEWLNLVRYTQAGNVNFKLTPDQEQKFVELFDQRLKMLNGQFGDEANGIVFRLGLITFRIAMVLTIIRCLEEKTLSETVECTDEDFHTSMILSDIYLDHGMAVFQSLPGSRNINSNATTFLEFLPANFTYSKAVKIGDLICNYSDRSVSTYLKELLDKGLISQPKRNGPYARIDLQ